MIQQKRIDDIADVFRLDFNRTLTAESKKRKNLPTDNINNFLFSILEILCCLDFHSKKVSKRNEEEKNMNTAEWSALPEEIFVKIFTELTYTERISSGSVCKKWHQFLKSPQLWFKVGVIFRDQEDESMKHIAQRYGEHIRHLQIKCYQQTTENCHNACQFIELLLGRKQLRIETFSLEFCEQNPLFYSGDVFVDVLKRFFLQTSFVKPIRKIDLSKFPVAFDNDLLNTITQNHAPGVESLNIQNKILVCRVSQKCLFNFVSKATNLKYLYIKSSCFESETLKLFAEPQRNRLKYLSLLFTRADKFFKCLSGSDWRVVREMLPDLRIELHFDHTYPLNSTFNIMLPEVPVSSLKLCLQATVNEHINLASSIYKQTLRTLVVTSTPSQDLDDAVLRAAKECKDLENIHVWCRMSRTIVNEILQIKPLRHYTLAYRE